MLRRAAVDARDQPILDIGVGGGRTVPLLRSVSADYLAIDYIEGLVHATRRHYPDARVQHMDARDLSGLGDDTFALVVFSCDGIDGVPHPDRPKVFGEIHRVLRPGGLFAYSTHNLDYRAPDRPHLPVDRRRIIAHPVSALRQAVRTPRMIRDYRRLRTLNARGEGWGSLATTGYGCAVVWHYVTLAGALRELWESGFATAELFGASGLEATIDTSRARAPVPDAGRSGSLHLVAYKPPAS